MNVKEGSQLLGIYFILQYIDIDSRIICMMCIYVHCTLPILTRLNVKSDSPPVDTDWSYARKYVNRECVEDTRNFAEMYCAYLVSYTVCVYRSCTVLMLARPIKVTKVTPQFK
jgi:hypothetical protein